MKRPHPYRELGVTLVEMLIVVFVVGILSIVIAPLLNSYVTSLRASYFKKQEVNNQAIGIALQNFAHDSTTLGTLPAPYTGNGYTSTVYNPTDASVAGQALTDALTQTGVNSSELNDDNYSSHRVRVYQRVAGLTMQTPLYFQSGPLVRLTYQYGAVYMTACPKGTSSCNPSASGVPGDSPVMTAANYATWTTTGTDLSPFFVTTLPLQKQMLANTAQKLDKVRDKLLSYFTAQQRTASGNDTTNWWLPNPGTMAGQSPATNQGCRDGWYDLSTNTTILPSVGLTTTEYGMTAWGGPIQFCRDYDPTGTKTPDAAPHLAAIRIHSSVSTGSAPDAVVVGNNLVLTF